MNPLPLDRAEEFLALLEDRLSKKTLKHVVSVAHFMNRLTNLCGLNREAAITAGLLHDYCKAMKNKSLLEAAETYGIPVPLIYQERPMLLHGPVAAEEVKRKLRVHDADVYEAIYHHTFGKAGMGPLGLALYVADFAEELRENVESAIARNLVDTKGFDAALRYVCDAKVEIVRKKNRALDPSALEFRQWVLETRTP